MSAPSGSAPIRPRVAIFGGGVSGLTAAQELAERGFHVDVYERAWGMRWDGSFGPILGGMAASQYSRVQRWRNDGLSPEEFGPSTRDPGLQAEGFFYLFGHEDGVCNDGAPPPVVPNPNTPEDRSVDAWLAGIPFEARHRVKIAVVGHTDPLEHPRNPAARWALAQQRAETVAADLAKRGWEKDRIVVIAASDFDPPVSGADAGEDPRLLRRWNRRVDVFLDGGMLPGEHGFRFFPAYYSHVFDTMQRIPVRALDRPTGKTVFDNLVPTSGSVLASEGLPPAIISLDEPRSIHDAVRDFKSIFRHTPATATDLNSMVVRLLRFLTTCSARREAETEDIGFLSYLQAFDYAQGRPRYVYSPAFLEVARATPRVLAAFDAEWGDARTCGDTTIQLSYGERVHYGVLNGTLNGPTSTAWFSHWRRHLELRGVRFHWAELDRIEHGHHGAEVFIRRGDYEGLRGRFGDETERLMPEDRTAPTYVVVATDVVTAERVTAPLREQLPGADLGVVSEVEGWATTVRTRPPKPNEPDETEPRDPLRTSGEKPWDRLQTLTGIQYYFRSKLDIATGHVYFADSAWGLSSLSQQQFWLRRPDLEFDGFVSVVSVDVGDWYAPSPADSPLKGLRPVDCTMDQLARETWRQMRRSLTGGGSSELGFIPEPDWYHVDFGVRFSDEAPHRFEENETPFLVPIAGDWERRPGAEPWDPTVRLQPIEREADPYLWQARHGGTRVHFGNLVFAGTWLKTLTRMTTMEAANESGRHAVNAILAHADEMAERRVEGIAPQGQPADGRSFTPSADDADSTSGNEAIARATRFGDFCRIFDPERLEPPAFRRYKELDEVLFDGDLPHLFDLLHLELAPQLASILGSKGKPVGDGGLDPLGLFDLDRRWDRLLRLVEDHLASRTRR